MSHTALDIFGEILMKRVRDASILDWDMIIDGRMKSPHSQRIRDMLASFDEQQLDILRRLIPQIIDTTIHHLLWMLEEEKSIDIAVHTEHDVVPNLREISDGLAGEQLGWVQQFSAQRYESLF